VGNIHRRAEVAGGDRSGGITDPAVAFQTVYGSSSLDAPVSSIRLIDQRFESTDSTKPVLAGSASKEIRTGWLVTVRVVNSGNAPLAGAEVPLFDRNGIEVVSGLTDASGLVTALLDTTVYRKSGTNPTQEDPRGPFRVVVRMAGFADQVLDNQIVGSNRSWI